MTFKFIDNEVIDPRTRRLIRSHVAKGRNLGKTHSRRRARAQVQSHSQYRSQTTSRSTSVLQNVGGSTKGVPALGLSLSFGRLLSTSTLNAPPSTGLSPFTFPLGLTSQSRRSLEKCSNCHVILLRPLPLIPCSGILLHGITITDKEHSSVHDISTGGVSGLDRL